MFAGTAEQESFRRSRGKGPPGEGAGGAKAGGGRGSWARLQSCLCLKHKEVTERTSFSLRASQGTWTLRSTLWERLVESEETWYEIQTNLGFSPASLGNGCVGGGDHFTF